MSSKSKSRGDYVCRVRYRNKLPSVPFEAKLVDLPSLANRNIAYHTNSLIEQTPHSLTMDTTSSVPFEKLLVDYLDSMETYPELNRRGNSPPGQVSEEDSILMIPPKDDNHLHASKRPGHVTWLRRSEYIATSSMKTQQQQQQTRDIRTVKISREDMEAHTYRTHESQMDGIAKTFVQPDVETLSHPRTKKRAKRCTPILPDVQCWDTTYTLGQFPGDPADAPRLRKRQANSSTTSQALSEQDGTDRGILQPISNPHDPNDNYLIWFLPDEESTSLLKRQKVNADDALGKPLTFDAVRDYTHRNENMTAAPNLLLTLRQGDDGNVFMRYSLIKSKLVVNKKRALAPVYRHLDDYDKPTVLTVTLE
ncbi:hypothetical protein DM01DRAFT_1340661 [Hesseltinella vesiculosa]|uniref:RNA polymerase II-associated n=1 Tax=Hesseltinella vesiculosa TaxID=101127 RepID=A0A1X2G3E2_9FUNG|nr:hypothetical protein DM01DRAFT_1340661 [Hesseltinella vesiculosa]